MLRRSANLEWRLVTARLRGSLNHTPRKAPPKKTRRPPVSKPPSPPTKPKAPPRQTSPRISQKFASLPQPPGFAPPWDDFWICRRCFYAPRASRFCGALPSRISRQKATRKNFAPKSPPRQNPPRLAPNQPPQKTTHLWVGHPRRARPRQSWAKDSPPLSPPKCKIRSPNPA